MDKFYLEMIKLITGHTDSFMVRSIYLRIKQKYGAIDNMTVSAFQRACLNESAYMAHLARTLNASAA